MNNREIAQVMEEPYYINNGRDKILSTTTNEILAYKTKKGWTSSDPDLKELVEKYCKGSTIGGILETIKDALIIDYHAYHG